MEENQRETSGLSEAVGGEAPSQEASSAVEKGEELQKRSFRKRYVNAKTLSYLGILTAIEVLLLFFGSAVPVGAGGATLNFSLVPIVLGAMLMGPLAGALLGFISGFVITLMVVFGLQGPVFLYLLNVRPVAIVLICLVKTTAAGFVCGLIYDLIRKKNQKVAVFVSSLAAPVVNTLVFILGCLMISGAVEASAAEFGLGQSHAFAIIILVFVTYNFFIEFAINLVLAPALFTVVRVGERQFARRRKAHA